MANRTLAANPTFLNNVSDTLIRERVNAKGHKFLSVSVPSEKSKTGWASIAVNKGQVKPATRKDGSIIEGRSNIFLGDAAEERKVNVAKTKTTHKYATIQVSNELIKEWFEGEREAYRAASAQ